MAKSDPSPVSAPKIKAPKHRSPNYPAMGLRRALERTKELYDAYKRGAIPLMVALQKWNYKQAMGLAAQTVAALKAYGLIDVEGDGDKKTIKVTDRSQMILGGHPDKLKLLRQAALAPAVFKEMWEKQNSGTETDEAMTVYLQWDRNFNPESIGGLIADFRDTISFAELVASDKMGEESAGVRPQDDPPAEDPSAGSKNMQSTIIPLSTNPKPPPATLIPVSKQDVFTTATGEVVVRWPAVLSVEDYADLEGWLEMLKRKIKRSISPNLKNDSPAKIEMDPT